MTLERSILKRLKPHCNPKRAAHDVGYVKSQLPTLGCSIPTVRKVAKQTFAELSTEYSHAQIRKMVSTVWKTAKTHDVMTVCLLYFSARKPQNDLSDWRVLKSWSTRIDNWAHSDVLSDIYADLLERHRKEVYPTFKEWNTHREDWKRRLSLTSLLYYSNSRNNALPVKKILPLVKARISDEHFYVQRAVGWTLRECGNLYPKPTEVFIKKHLTDLSSIAFTTATEKWSKTKKEPLKRARKKARKS